MISRYKNEKISDNVKPLSIKPAMIMLVTAIFIFTLTQMVYLSMLGTKGSDVSALRREKTETFNEMRKMDEEVSELKSIIRLQDVAINKLGLKAVSQIRILKREEVVSSLVTSD